MKTYLLTQKQWPVFREVYSVKSDSVKSNKLIKKSGGAEGFKYKLTITSNMSGALACCHGCRDCPAPAWSGAWSLWRLAQRWAAFMCRPNPLLLLKTNCHPSHGPLAHLNGLRPVMGLQIGDESSVPRVYNVFKPGKEKQTFAWMVFRWLRPSLGVICYCAHGVWGVKSQTIISI